MATLVGYPRYLRRQALPRAEIGERDDDRSSPRYPRLGTELEGEEWSGFRFVLGPWRWMVIVYEVNAGGDRVVIVTVQDGRSSNAAPAPRSITAEHEVDAGENQRDVVLAQVACAIGQDGAIDRDGLGDIRNRVLRQPRPVGRERNVAGASVGTEAARERDA